MSYRDPRGADGRRTDAVNGQEILNTSRLAVNLGRRTARSARKRNRDRPGRTEAHRTRFLLLRARVNNTSDGGQDYGGFDVAVDNEFIALNLGGIAPDDVNGDGTIFGNGTGPATSDDVTEFVEGWLNQKVINGIQIGDLSTRRQGDLNFDGITNLADWSIGMLASSCCAPR